MKKTPLEMTKSNKYDYASARSIHIDFHNSALIPGIGSAFDPEIFTRTLVEAHVNRVAIFAKCHHGWSYYPTKIGFVHPTLATPDLLGEMLMALKKVNILASVYITVGFDEEGARLHPEWRQMTKAGRFADEIKGDRIGNWKFMNFTHPEYIRHIGELSRELVDRYDFHGLFYDILFYHEEACWSPASLAFRKKHCLMGEDLVSQKKFEVLAQRNFMKQMERYVGKKYRNLSVFYNSTNHAYIEREWSFEHRSEYQSHFEIESLASGVWGYHHFPRMARQVNQWGTGWMGQTGRFQKMWGDFGGIKPVQALEYECYRCQALGGGNVVGDQMLPDGRLDQGAYRLIGKVFQQCEAAAPFYHKTQPLKEVGVFVASDLTLSTAETCHSEEGAVMMCEELHYESAVLNDASDLFEYRTIILPDTTVMTSSLAKKLELYYKKGGNLILSFRSGFDAEGKWALSFLSLQFEGGPERVSASEPSYWRTRKNFLKEHYGDDRVVYHTGMKVIGGKGTEVLVDRVSAHFKRSDLAFCSHFQTPPKQIKEKHAAVIRGDRFIYFADPLFFEYRKSGNILMKAAWSEGMLSIHGEPWVGAGLPSTVLSVTREQKKSLSITLLHYVPVRKSFEIDMIEERMNFSGQFLKLPDHYQSAVLFPSGEKLKKTEKGFELPNLAGRLMIQVL